MSSHTPSVQLYYQINSKMRFDAGFRYYYQNGAYFYSSKRDAFTDETFASSDERLSDFNAYEPSIGFNYDILEDVNFNLGGSYYDQSTGLSAVYIITGFKYSF
jgi:hypothetical protein